MKTNGNNDILKWWIHAEKIALLLNSSSHERDKICLFQRMNYYALYIKVVSYWAGGVYIKYREVVT